MKLWFDRNKLWLACCLSLLLIGVGCSAIYWPSGFIVVGGLIWLDLFVTDLVVHLKMERSDGSSR
jgi:hypothetical protein